ncbi:nucleotidyl transferase AbiEii/AbiGii toxin family protein [Kineobactrum salinum]|uniref:WYL domain-containing protein n=1 Tax=Kineobactrum salinum TaxID=2708301 RepID=A0A6C0U059_9GAMM|nr:nucleotidyl transferase AbiEii/AbiGii toxin family protein [Kineobactrum salinum]QIB65163.1 hypothetical protein G3T16_06845 [Kineobactrum salinum]
MIDRDELLALADETGLTPVVVEKDYVLGWLLAAVNANERLAESWIFKGGTCLKKCYFETYRFSEDLDFTLRDDGHLDERFLLDRFSEMAEWLYDQSGIEIPTDRFKFDIYDNPRGGRSCEGRVYYQSFFVKGNKNFPKIKFDLTSDEVLVMPPSRQPVFHGYSDEPGEGIHIDCYAYPEIFGEKVRALGERGRPRDLYDVVNLYRNDNLPASAVVRDVLNRKCAYKKIERPGFAAMANYRDTLEQNWAPMLAHQLPSLPSLDVYWEALPEFFDWLEGAIEVARPALGAVAGEGELYRPTYGRLGLRTTQGGSLEVIRFAAGNRLCVELDYTDQQGRRSTRIIEPYSLRRAQNGNVLLYGVRADNRQIRAYSISNINSASITNKVFVPLYQVELSPGSMSVPTVSSASGDTQSLGLPQGRRELTVSRRRPSGRRQTSVSQHNGPTYVFRCPMCQKTFKRKKMNGKLNPHKGKSGWNCMGRMGIYERTDY